MNETFNLLGIDPGNHIGVACIEVDCSTFSIRAVTSTTITLERYVVGEDITPRLLFLREKIASIYNYYLPPMIAMESPFLNMRFPKAIIQLSQYIGTIESTLLELNPFLRIIQYAPMYVKSVFAGTGQADKDAMSVALSKNKELNKLANIENMSEHEVDATGIAYTLLLEIRKHNFYQLAIR